ncbi:MAG: aminodeoxychorismate synthase component I [Prevotella sp.]|jgi:para-aminobenzoate synthetase component 1|nr:aminodeoxychorismate synthase component I [Prevotella sp.]MCH3986225.1 aminodeoxychorismate synthase component I [Prevotella sp.]MCH3992874.1 aminodeoxychorismate synthase component I [Prevotella sp.]MCH4018937.1 aminodeoxychorismate synthase component I [Prevotella sp.]MCH4099455.1 aminodeoxychorismate synthase component I [Prevotella sp.]MCI1324228.1 aminodeoxychorismate synthase component I [Prevotella sp.]
MLDKITALRQMNKWGQSHQPFIFIISYDQSECIVLKPEDIDPQRLLFHFNRFTNESLRAPALPPKQISWSIDPPAFEQYQKAFQFVTQNEMKGNSYLTNLTSCTRLKTNMTLQNIYTMAKARYKLWIRNQFTVFSPETFIQIKGHKIYSFPMKGTIDATLENAAQNLLNDPKEKAEHATITDLIRNDLSRIASHVMVERYRYVEEIQTNGKTLLETSSRISGILPDHFYPRLGDLFFSLLPAGSITGAPKDKTISIINEAEHYNRKFYTGVAGYFDGDNLDSGVLIRFIEEEPDGSLIFKSGGGITAKSNCKKEYQELKEKVYVPIY